MSKNLKIAKCGHHKVNTCSNMSKTTPKWRGIAKRYEARKPSAQTINEFQHGFFAFLGLKIVN